MAENELHQKPLFRPASLRARAHAWEGQPSLTLGLPATFTTLASVVLALATVALIAFGSYARRVDLHGAMLPKAGLIAIAAPASGWIESLAVKEGASVAQGTPLYTLDVDTTTKAGDVQAIIANVLGSERKVFSNQIDRVTAVTQETEQNLKQKVDNLNNQIAQLDTQIATSEGFYKTLDDEYKLYLGLLANRQVPRNEFSSRQQVWMRAKTDLQTLQSNKLRLIGDLNDAEYKLATLDADTSDQIDALKAKISEIDEKLAAGEAKGSIVIRAPGAGVITDLVAKPGQMVKAGAPMLTIVPADADMQVVLLAPSSAIGFVHTGQRVLLRYSAFPYQKFGERPGTVISVARAALDAEQAKALAGAGPALEKDTAYYRVIVAPDRQYVDIGGERRSLPANMRVDAFALLDQRPLYQWILEPLYAFSRAAHQG